MEVGGKAITEDCVYLGMKKAQESKFKPKSFSNHQLPMSIAVIEVHSQDPVTSTYHQKSILITQTVKTRMKKQ